MVLYFIQHISSKILQLQGVSDFLFLAQNIWLQ